MHASSPSKVSHSFFQSIGSNNIGQITMSIPAMNSALRVFKEH